MKYCKKCTMPDTRPGITFDAEGVCCACRNYEGRVNVDWDKRWKEFEELCGGDYLCLLEYHYYHIIFQIISSPECLKENFF